MGAMGGACGAMGAMGGSRGAGDAGMHVTCSLPVRWRCVLQANGTDVWPFGIPWLNDAYPVPYMVKQQQQQAAKAAEPALSTP